MRDADEGYALAYGDDDWSTRAGDALRELFETDCDVYFVTTGTAANALALASLCRSYQAVVCHRVSHVQTDECGAPEFFTGGAKVMPVDGPHAKVDPKAVESLLSQRNDVHVAKPRVLSLTQCTELGTVYNVDELTEIGAPANRLNLHLHMDGARFANAVASLDVAPAEITWKRGVDVLSFGGTKNGMGLGEAVVFFDRTLSQQFAYQHKQGGQLTSKMRYFAAPWVEMLRSGAWLDNARHANRMAAALGEGLASIAGVDVAHPVQTNGVFATLSDTVIQRLAHGGWRYYSLDGNCARFMTSWRTTEQDVGHLMDAIRGAT